MSDRNTFSRQSGITLIVTLVMLVVLTLFAVTAMRLSGVNLRITGNFQWQKEMELLTDSALEQIASTSGNFDNATVQAQQNVIRQADGSNTLSGSVVDQNICADGTVVAAGACTLTNAKIGTVSIPRCTASRPATGYTKKIGELAPEDTDWVIKADATDRLSGARVKITRGITVRLLAGNCPE